MKKVLKTKNYSVGSLTKRHLKVFDKTRIYMTKVPEANDEASGERLPLQYGVGRRQQCERLQQSYLQIYLH